MEIYSEATVHRQITSNPQKIKNLFLGAFLLPLALGILMHPLWFILAAITGLMYVWTLKNTDLEYDYILVNDELQIDRVLSGKSRKNMAMIHLGQVLQIAPYGAPELDGYVKVISKDYSAGDYENPPYILVYTKDGLTFRVAIQFPEEMLELIRKQIPDKVIK